MEKLPLPGSLARQRAAGGSVARAGHLRGLAGARPSPSGASWRASRLQGHLQARLVYTPENLLARLDGGPPGVVCSLRV